MWMVGVLGFYADQAYLLALKGKRLEVFVSMWSLLLAVSGCDFWVWILDFRQVGSKLTGLSHFTKFSLWFTRIDLVESH